MKICLLSLSTPTITNRKQYKGIFSRPILRLGFSIRITDPCIISIFPRPTLHLGFSTRVTNTYLILWHTHGFRILRDNINLKNRRFLWDSKQISSLFTHMGFSSTMRSTTFGIQTQYIQVSVRTSQFLLYISITTWEYTIKGLFSTTWLDIIQHDYIQQWQGDHIHLNHTTIVHVPYNA